MKNCFDSYGREVHLHVHAYDSTDARRGSTDQPTAFDARQTDAALLRITTPMAATTYTLHDNTMLLCKVQDR